MLFLQKSEILLVWPTSPSDSRTVSSTPALPNSSLQTSSLTRPSTSCLYCENDALSQQLFFCCSYRTIYFFLLSKLICRILFFFPLFLLRLGANVEGTRRNSEGTFQHFKESFADCNYRNQLSVYTVVCVQVERQLLAILAWFS